RRPWCGTAEPRGAQRIAVTRAPVLTRGVTRRRGGNNPMTASGRRRPNILVLLNDHQPYYRHGWDAGPRVQRPHFDRLAREGAVFERAYCAAPLCAPARRSLLTGLAPHKHGEIRNDVCHPFDRPTFPELLAESGYRTSWIGKWHAGPGTAADIGCRG